MNKKGVFSFSRRCSSFWNWCMRERKKKEKKKWGRRCRSPRRCKKKKNYKKRKYKEVFQSNACVCWNTTFFTVWSLCGIVKKPSTGVSRSNSKNGKKRRRWQQKKKKRSSDNACFLVSHEKKWKENAVVCARVRRVLRYVTKRAREQERKKKREIQKKKKKSTIFVRCA